MDKILSQEEVNALLRGVESGEIETESEAEALEGVRPYDLTQQDQVLRGRMPTLEVLNERFAKTYQVELGELIRKGVEIHPVAIESMRFGEFIKNVPLPSCINVFKMEPLRGHALWVFDAQLAYLLVDYFFGGSGQTHVKVEGRDFTAIELRVIRKLVSPGMESLQKAWSPVIALTPRYQRTEINPQFAAIVTDPEGILLVSFDLDMEGVTGKMYFCFPHAMMEPIWDRLSAVYQSDREVADKRWIQQFRERLSECAVGVTVLLGHGTIRVRDLLYLQEGDILVLDQRVDEEIPALVEGVPKFWGRPGVHRGSLAFQVTREIQPEEVGHGRE